MNEILERTRKALFEVFGQSIDPDAEKARALIERHTHTGEDDPGGWSREAAVVIHAECIPLPVPVEIPAIEDWCRVSDMLGDHFCEHINNAVTAVYRL